MANRWKNKLTKGQVGERANRWNGRLPKWQGDNKVNWLITILTKLIVDETSVSQKMVVWQNGKGCLIDKVTIF